MANDKQAWTQAEANAQVGSAFLVAGVTEIARLQTDLEELREAVSAHLDILSGKITGGMSSPTLILASSLDLRRLIRKDD